MVLRKIGEAYIPDMVIYNVDETVGETEGMPQFSRGKSQKNGKVTIHVCKDFTCAEPLTVPEDIERHFL